MEGVPLHPFLNGAAMAGVSGVRSVHDLHNWRSAAQQTKTRFSRELAAEIIGTHGKATEQLARR
jgi:hypothetical protein